MKYLSRWQPLIDEDRHTALLFGFFRHAPAEAALDAWLSRALGREVTAERLEQKSFWPRFPSVNGTALLTEPELVIDAHDGSPLTVVIEVKPGFGGFVLEQIEREAVDVASARQAERICCVMVSADHGAPVDLRAWEEEVQQALTLAVPNATVDLRYSSFAEIGSVISECGRTAPAWRTYAEDVLSQLRLRGLLEYEGAPMLDDLGEFSLTQAVEAFNRGVRAARKFYLELHAQPRFAQMGLRPYWHQGFRMWRNPASSALTQEEYWFQTTSVVSMYATNATDETHALFANFNLVATPEAAALCVGVCRVVEGHIVESFAFGTANEPATDPQVTAAVASGFPHTVIHRLGEWAFASRPWLPETGDKDIEWALEHLERAASTLAAAKGA